MGHELNVLYTLQLHTKNKTLKNENLFTNAEVQNKICIQMGKWKIQQLKIGAIVGTRYIELNHFISRYFVCVAEHVKKRQ